MRTANASPQLVQLRQSELVGTIDDNGVGSRYVDAGFNDGGAEQDIEALLVEIAHGHFKFALAHLAVSNANARLRNQAHQVFFNLADGDNIVVQKIYLPSAL